MFPRSELLGKQWPGQNLIIHVAPITGQMFNGGQIIPESSKDNCALTVGRQ